MEKHPFCGLFRCCDRAGMPLLLSLANPVRTKVRDEGFGDLDGTVGLLVLL